ncbi:MAG: hypothetical protein LBS53_10445 [Synergistaceae bacterium]|jgi:DNA topoisomerase-3|nr:hypothetical protein [Synergistaceae bacterium]
MKLYICEKSSLGRALADVLPGEKAKGGDCIRCGADVVAWASGHLLELFEPEDYDERYKHWSRDTLMYVPEKWKLKEIPRTKGLLSGIRKLLKEADTVVNVGDADREGTLLINEILDYCGWRGKTERLRINDMNPGVIRRALDAIKDNEHYRGEYMAGQARLYADWLVGLSLTRFVTVSLREVYETGTISVGRVQTPTLGLVVARDREILNFTPSLYYDITTTLALGGERKITGRWVPKDSSPADEHGHIADKGAAHKLAQSLEGVDGVITAVTKKTRKASPPLPYSLPKLQMAASKKYDITDTLVHVQKLYESGYVTYPRAGCEYIPEGHFPEAPKVMDAIRAGCPDMADMIGGADLTRKSPAWDTSKISEHHAIIPTARVPIEGALSGAERKIYGLVCSRYVLQFLADYEYEETSVEFEVAGEVFRATGRTVINLGWQGWDKQDEPDGHIKLEEARENAGGCGDDETHELDVPGRSNPQNAMDVLPPVKQGEAGGVHAVVLEKTTKPPSRYTYHSLLAAMNNIHLFIKDPEIRMKLKEVQGIGTEATQENIIGVLFKRGYLAKKKKQVVSTDLGKLLIDILSVGKASVMVSPDMTALWEKRMADIEGGAPLGVFISEVADMVRDIISGRLEVPPGISDMPGVTKKRKCLTEGCAGYLRHIAPPKKSPFFSCPVCNKTFNDVAGAPAPRKEWEGEIVEVPCPLNCGKNARRFEGKYGYYWKCLCSPDVTFKDVGGAPAAREERTEAKCPVSGCKGKAVRLESKKDGRAFWKCGVCGNFFDDVDGKPVTREIKGSKGRK